MPSRLITSIILQTLETNVRFAQNLTDFVAGVQNIHKAEARRETERATSAAGNVGAAQDPGKFVFRFGGGTADGSAGMRELLGGKGANLAEMCNLGLPVPPGFTITTDVCSAFYAHGRNFPEGLETQVKGALAFIGKTVGAKFGDAENPLLVSVRSGARASMPGMMDTVLNLGLNDATVEALSVKSGDRRFAYDSYRRFIQMYSDVVLGVPHHVFEDILENYKKLQGFERDTDMSAADWQTVIGKYKDAVETELGQAFPQDIHQQLWGAIGAVFSSWNTPRAATYRRLQNIPDEWGTAVNVQAMVFGNLGTTSATGVAFTRNPSTGENQLYGEFLVNAQGEDVVAGIRTPQNITEAARIAAGSDEPSLEALMPDTFAEFRAVCNRLEAHYRDMQDIEFTIQEGKLWLLQTRSGKRTLPASLKIGVEMAEAGVISREEAVARIDPLQLDQLLHPTIDPDAEKTVIAVGLAASPGAACGEIVFDPDEAAKLKSEGRTVILVRSETSPDDINGMDAAAGILTSRGGMTSHAAVVARGWGRPCISGASSVRIDYAKGEMTAGGHTLKAGDIITIDGSTGEVILGEAKVRQPEVTGDFAKLMGWADGMRRMKIRANAETPRDAAQAREFGAEGIGLCRTEHMFFEGERIVAMREMIMAGDEAGRRTALAKILPMQRQDFVELFEIMAGFPVTIRLLDPPLHEFLPHDDAEIAEMAVATGIDAGKLKARVAQLTESNPMLGHRGCRLAITYPEIAEMQARAIFEAAIETGAKTGQTVALEIMVPLVAMKTELDILRDRIVKVANDVAAEKGVRPQYQIGTMIELPRAALQAGKIAETAEFFSFGTNDLTQTAFGLSRDDAASFLGQYTAKGVLKHDPFVTLDQEGVGELVAIAAERGRSTRPKIKLGICGEHGGDPASIAFCEGLGLDYVSCSPYRVPVARLAAAQATLSARK
ncbi:MAG: pyruvate, phosphate dikinase [Hyphomicrobiales bacterium]|nr:pyruvate, phosphate dikinase [Hyphomicrobiales bacterium]